MPANKISHNNGMAQLPLAISGKPFTTMEKALFHGRLRVFGEKKNTSVSLIGIFTPKTTRYSGSINKSCNKTTTPDAKNGNDPVFSPRKIQGKITGKLLYCLSKPDIMALKARKLHGTLCTALYGNASDDETGG